MKLPTTRLPKSKFGRLRPWILPIAFVITLFAIIDRPFDAEALREELRAGHTEDALRSLQGSQPGQLPLDIAAVNWWPHDARQQRIRSLRAHAAKDPDESLAYPTISSPLDAWRHPRPSSGFESLARKISFSTSTASISDCPSQNFPSPLARNTYL